MANDITTKVFLAFKDANVLLEWNRDVYVEKAVKVSKEFDPEAFVEMVRKHIGGKAKCPKLGTAKSPLP